MAIVDEKTLQHAALQLLASSTSRRYAREAARIAEESGLVDAVRGDARVAELHLERLEELLAVVTQAEQTPEEFEAALLLCALARCGDEMIMSRLRTLAQPSQLRSPWLKALAMRIPQFGPPAPHELDALRERIQSLLVGSVRLLGALDMLDNRDPKAFPRAA
jgi:hypothetical protein